MATMSFDYSKTSSGVTIERYRGSSSVVDIPYSIAGKSVTKIGDRTFAGCKEIKQINIPYCVTEIAIDAFAGCTDLIFLCGQDSPSAQFAVGHGFTVR